MIGVTGANGFVGKALVSRLVHDGASVTAFARDPDTILCSAGMNVREFPDLDRSSDFSDVTREIDVLVHCAARVHVMNDSSADPLAVFLNANFEATVNLARSAAKAGVTRFIFISSIKVNGDVTKAGKPFTEQCPPTTQDPYGISKYRAEKELMEIAEQTGMEVVIIRPVLVYGPGVKGNMASLIKLVRKKWPLPFGSVDNKRSMIGITNLVDLVITCLDHPSARNQIFLASDGNDRSLSQILRCLSDVSDSRSMTFRFSARVLKYFLYCIGKRDIADRLLGSLQVDISKAKKELGWIPNMRVDDELRQCMKFK
ncbi:SDR family oxidoreductase [Pseudomonadales bacterium]|nr:SDR family oxidoreductase [Pseudomonadales bacterium]